MQSTSLHYTPNNYHIMILIYISPMASDTGHLFIMFREMSVHIIYLF